MAIKRFRPGRTTIVSSARGRAKKIPPPLAEMPGGLYPLRMAVWETDEYRMANGWPVKIPQYDIRASGLISAEGETLADRESARAVTTGADARWIADSETFDLDSLRWLPFEGPLIWQTAPEYSPTFISDYEYEIRSEIYLGEALNFDSDSFEHMWTDTTSFLGGASGYTVIMCMSLNSVYGNNLDVPYSGLWCPGYPTPAVGQPLTEAIQGGWVSLTLQGNSLYLETDQSKRTKALSITHLLDTAAPIMVALVVNRPTTRVYAGRGPSTMSHAALSVGSEVVPMDGHVVLGRTPGDILHTADMAMQEIGIYRSVLTPRQVQQEFSLLSSVYGGDK